MLVSDLFPHVEPDVIGCPYPTMAAAIVHSAFQLCDRSGVWSELQDPLTMLNGVSLYELDAPTDAVMLRVSGAWVDGSTLEPIRFPAPSALRGFPRGYHAAVDRGSITLHPTPGQSGTLVVRAVFAPKLTATTLPDFLVSRYLDGLVSGAKNRLMLMPGLAWSNPQLAVYHENVFNTGVATARDDVLTDGVGGSVFARPRSFF